MEFAWTWAWQTSDAGDLPPNPHTCCPSDNRLRRLFVSGVHEGLRGPHESVGRGAAEGEGGVHGDLKGAADPRLHHMGHMGSHVRHEIQAITWVGCRQGCPPSPTSFAQSHLATRIGFLTASPMLPTMAGTTALLLLMYTEARPIRPERPVPTFA